MAGKPVRSVRRAQSNLTGRSKADIIEPPQQDPPFGGGTHSPLPLPERNLLALAEPNFANCSQGLATSGYSM